MSLKNHQTGKLLGLQHHKNKKLKLHPQTETAAFKLLDRFDPTIKAKILAEEHGLMQLEYLLSLGPKKLYKMGMLEGAGWRRGYTK